MLSELDKMCRDRKVTATVTFDKAIPYDQRDKWQREATAWTVRLRYNGRSLTVPYWTGSAITDEPTAADVLYSVIMDTSAGEYDFDDFCGEFGYDDDSRKAEKTWKSCKTIARKTRQFLGDDFDKFANCEH